MSSQQIAAAASLIFHQPARGIPRRSLRDYARRLQADVGAGRAFVCLIADDDELQRLNREFRKKNYPTDVLSFPSSESNGFLGDIAISFNRACTQAEEHRHSVDEEIRILMLHGVLHLVGMDHEKDSGEMACTERRWRRHFKLPAGLIDRVKT
jgi:probable rRNA maturation factor